MKFRLTGTCKTTPAKESVITKQSVTEDVAPTGVAPAVTSAECTNKSNIADVHKEAELIDTPLFEDDKEHLNDETDEVGDVVEIGADFADDASEGTDISLDGLDDADIDTAPANAGTGIAEEIRTVMSSITDNISALNQIIVDAKAYNADETVEKVLNSIVGSENRTLGELQGLLLAFDVPAQAAYEGIEAVSNEVAEAGIAASSLDETPAVFDDCDMSEEDMNSYLEIAENFTPSNIDLNTLDD